MTLSSGIEDRMRPTSLLTPPKPCWGGVAPRPDADVASAVEDLLASWLYARLSDAGSLDRVFCDEVARPVAEFVLRGGKRLRASFAWWGWRAAGGDAEGDDAHAVLQVAAALELLQALALIHDDLMDGSELRRGTPAVHVDYARRHRAEGMRGSADRFGVGGAVLAGDLALVWAEDLLTEARLGQAAYQRVRPPWRAMRTELVAGQYLDLRTQATADLSPDRALHVASLKTAAYTVQHPLAIGAALADAGPDTLCHLRAAGHCAGVAFQLHDDLDGVFGEPADTGKPSGEDVREGKATYLAAVALQLAERRGDSSASRVMRRTFGDPHLSREALREYRRAVVDVGARDAVTAHIETLVTRSVTELSRARLDAHAEHRIADLIRTATGVVRGAANTGPAAGGRARR